MKKIALALLCVSSFTYAQSATPGAATSAASRAVNAPCWISLDLKPPQGPFGEDTYAADIIKGFHKVPGTGIVNLIMVGTNGPYNFPVDTGGIGHQDDYINQMRLRIAACFGDTTLGLGVGLTTKQ